MIEVQDIKKSFDGVEVLKGISATFHKGKTNLIIGQSGSGKTVFLKTLLGLFVPDSGHIIYDGVRYNDMNKEQRRKLRQEMGMVFQGSALFDSMTVEENVMFPLQMFSKLSAAEMKDRVDFVLEKVNLVNAHHKKPSEISGGMQKRVAIARAVVNEPKYLFCDEPNSGLDPKTAIVIDNLIHTVTEEFNITTIINTHDMNSVMTIGEKIVYLRKGVKEWEGNKDILINAESQYLIDFVYSSELFKELRQYLLNNNKNV